MENEDFTILNNAIYYPFIDMPDDSWFRTSILFWDTINPIVPRDVYRSMKSTSLLKVLESNDAASPIFPDDYSGGSEADVFTESVLVYAENFKQQFASGTVLDTYSKIHRHKMPWRLQEELEEMGLLHKIPGDYDWYYLYEPLADVFMGELARIIANDRRMTPITDKSRSSKYIFGLPARPTTKPSLLKTFRDFFSQQDEQKTIGHEVDIRQVALQFLFEKVLPTPSASFDLETLLKIKDDNKELLYKFRNSFRSALDEIREKQSESEVIEGLERYNDKIQADALRLKELFSEYDEDITFSDFGAVLSIDKPIKLLSTLGLTAAGITVSPLFFVGLVFFVGFEATRGRHELRKGIQKTLRECEGAYVFKLKEELSNYVNSV